MNSFLENACLNPKIATVYQRQKVVKELVNPVSPQKHKIVFPNDSDDQANYLVFDLRQIITEKLQKSGENFSVSYPLDCIPDYAKMLKSRYKAGIITGFMDSPSHSRYLNNVVSLNHIFLKMF